MSPIKAVFILLAMMFHWQTLAQTTDTIPVTEDIHVRSFDQSKLNKLKEDKQYDYGIRQATREGIFVRIYRGFMESIDWMFRKLFNTKAPPGSAWIVMALFAIAAAFLVVRFLDINLKKPMFKNQGTGTMEYTVEEENIHELDFKTLIDEAVGNRNYRLGIRYLYLFSLKKLADNGLIEWIPGKTNHEYEWELRDHRATDAFSTLGYYFEYAWYGDFDIDQEGFGKAQMVFNKLEETLVK